MTGHRQEVLLEQLLEIKQWYDELEKQHPVAATVVDVTPIIGDIMCIAEAIQDPSLLNIGIAAAGIVPGLGDAIATATKGAKKLFGREADGAKETKTLFHYTDDAGLESILKSKQLNPSLKANNPKVLLR